ncbi:Uncharacterised protein [Gordonia paraffinivorans]|uniref:PDZ domain-containing protein n=1 Tax=Gordonia paraffinivorans TaxID=175628 RepID=A0ABD7V078_9ACTN|nr:Uncharacterised protein [Gordonia paraffinivorans]
MRPQGGLDVDVEDQGGDGVVRFLPHDATQRARHVQADRVVIDDDLLVRLRHGVVVVGADPDLDGRPGRSLGTCRHGPAVIIRLATDRGPELAGGVHQGQPIRRIDGRGSRNDLEVLRQALRTRRDVPAVARPSRGRPSGSPNHTRAEQPRLRVREPFPRTGNDARTLIGEGVGSGGDLERVRGDHAFGVNLPRHRPRVPVGGRRLAENGASRTPCRSTRRARRWPGRAHRGSRRVRRR